MSTLGSITMSLSRARPLAEKIVDALRDHCGRIEIAGSIRRGRAICGDIDLVCQPKTGGRAEIIDRCKSAGTLLKHGEQYVVFILKNGFQLDLWFAHNGGGDMFRPEPSNFGVLLLARTGSAMHNVYIADRAKECRLHFNPHKGILRGDEVIASAEEADIFQALDLAFVAPERRER